MTKTKIGEKGLKEADIKERDKLTQQLEEAFSEVEQSINNYQQHVEAINGWIIKMREKFQAYYVDRSKDWQGSKDGASSVYESFEDQWDSFGELEGFEDKLEEMRELLKTWMSDLENLPEHPERRTKAPEIKLFSRKI
jgi:hypothetical protein